MKQLSYLIFISTIVLAGCSKQQVCLGPDCVYPEAIVAVDSISGDAVYATLINNMGDTYIATLSLRETDTSSFNSYAGEITNASMQPENNTDMKLKVYYVADDQSYVTNDAEYINASKTTLEIIAFGDNLQLTY